MIISLGILSLLQLTLVPGLILTKVFRIRGFWENLIAAIGLSQIFNYMFVVLAVFFKVYSQATVLILFGVEIVLLFVLYFSNLRGNLGKILSLDNSRAFFKDYTANIISKEEWKKKFLTFLYYFVFFVAVYCLFKNFFLYVTHPTQIFISWDAVVSWDNWATQWYHGLFPINTEHYPQLWTTNLSIPYQFIGTTEIKYFSKYFANLIEFFIVLLVFILGIKKRNIGYFFGVFFTSWLMIAFGSQGSGYADSPVAFWGLMAISCLLLSIGHDDEQKLIFLGALFVAGAALTKQAGLWLVLAYPILIVLIRAGKQKKSAALVIQSLLIMVLLIAPWYVFKEIQIRTGEETSEVGRVTSLVLDRNNFVGIIRSAGNLFIASLKNYYLSKSLTFILLIVLLMFSYKDRIWGWISTIIIIPFSIGWIFFFSYESRNLGLIIPLMGIALGIGMTSFLHLDIGAIKKLFHKKISINIIQVTGKTLKKIAKFLLSVKIWYFLLLVPLIFVLPHWVSDSRLFKNSLIKQRTIGDTAVNQLLYDYKNEFGLDGKIISSYPYLGFLPELKEYNVYHTTKTSDFFDLFNDPEVGYGLFNDHWWSEQVKEYVMGLVETNKIELIFSYPTPSQNGTFYFVTTCHGVCK